MWPAMRLRSEASRSRRSAFSLVEAVIASFLLLTSLLVVAALVDSSLRTQAKAEQYLIASTVASNELDKLRGYAARYGMEKLDAFDGQSFPSEADSNYKVKLTVSPYVLAVPNSSLESNVPDDSKKLFRNSARFIKVSASWSDVPGDSVDVSSLISDWKARDFEVKISAGGPTSVNADQTIALQASSGELDDLVYTWYTEPLTGLGSIRDVSRDGQKAVYVNRYRTPANRYVVYPGNCRVVARAKFRNVVKTGEIVVTNLD